MNAPATRRALLAGAAAAASLGHVSGARGDVPLRVGLLLGLTGPLSRTSGEIAYGFALALDQVDRQAAGRPIYVVVEDTGGKAGRAVERFVKLVQSDRVDVVVGPTSSPEALALRDAAHDIGVPLIVPNAGVTALTGEKCSPFVLRVSYSHEQIAAPLGTWMAQSGRARSAYLLGADNTSGRDHVVAFRKGFAASGGDIGGEEFVPPGALDLAPYLAKLKLMRADAIFASFFGDAAQRFLDGVGALGLRNLRICGPGWLVSTLDLPRIGGRAVGIIGATPYLADLDIASNRDFVSAFTQRHTRPPSEFAAQGYDAARLLLAGIEALEGNLANRRATAMVLARTGFVGARGALAIDPRTNNIVQDIHIFETRKRPGGEGIDFEPLARIADVAADAETCQMG
jgi:branched-chain amino acid transport system substrate-binding protein